MTDDLDDRLSKRFEDENGDDNEESQNDMNSQNSEIDRNAQSSQKSQNVKKDWNVRSFYLDDELNQDLMTTYKRLDLELSEGDTDIELKKTRHFYPLVIRLGLERLESMESTEITERIEE